MKIGGKMRQLRSAAGMSAMQVAELMGIGRPHLSHLEADKRSVKLDLLQRWANALGYRLHVVVVPDSSDAEPVVVEPDLQPFLALLRVMDPVRRQLLFRYASGMLRTSPERFDILRAQCAVLEQQASSPSPDLVQIVTPDPE